MNGRAELSEKTVESRRNLVNQAGAVLACGSCLRSSRVTERSWQRRVSLTASRGSNKAQDGTHRGCDLNL